MAYKASKYSLVTHSHGLAGLLVTGKTLINKGKFMESITTSTVYKAREKKIVETQKTFMNVTLSPLYAQDKSSSQLCDK